MQLFMSPASCGAVTESKWNIELKFERDGYAVYTLSYWEPGKTATSTRSSVVNGRWKREGSTITVTFSGTNSGKEVIHEVTECLSCQAFGAKGCSPGLNPVTNTMTNAY